MNVTIGGSASGTGLCDGSNFTAYIDYSAVSDGSVSVTADISDAAGNSATQSTTTLTKDTAAPTVTITNTGWINASNYTSYAVTGSCDEASRTVNIGGSVTSSATCDGSNFSVNLDYTSIPDGSISITADIDDASANDATQASASLNKDILAPSLSITDNGTIDSSNKSAYTVEGSCSDVTSGTTSQTVSITGSVTDSINCDGTNYSKSIDFSSVSEGSVTINASVADAAGNTQTASLSITKDAKPIDGSFDPLPGFTSKGIPLNWTDGSSGVATGFIIYRQDSGNGDITWTPSTGTSYSFGEAQGLGHIVYAGTGLSATDQYELEQDKTYIYKIFAHDASQLYSLGVQALSRTYPYQTIASAGNHNCATKFGRLRCWGANTNGVLGYSDTTTDHIGDDELPYTVGDINIGKDVMMATIGEFSGAAASSHACVLTEEGKIRCWGDGSNGRLGNNDTADILPSSFPPPDLAFSDTFIHIASGNRSNCALTNKGKVKCWGLNNQGQLGADSTNDLGDDSGEIEAISEIALTTTVIKTTGGTYSSQCAITADHKLRCWGDNANGRGGQDLADTTDIGNGSGIAMSALGDIALGDDIVDFAGSYQTHCALTDQGGIKCWGACWAGVCGDGASFQPLGDSTNTMSNVKNADLEAPAGTYDSADLVATGLALNSRNACATNSLGQVKCWGSNATGSLGYGNTTGGSSPANNSWHDFGSKVVQLSAKGERTDERDHMCALTASGEIYCWGDNENGALGYGFTDNWGDSSSELATDLTPVSVWGPMQASPDTVRPSELIAWYDTSDLDTMYEDAGCSDIAEDGDTVLCWQDKFGSQNLNTTGLGGPTATFNSHYGKAALSFDGTNNICTSSFSGLSGAQAFTVFIVLEWEDDTDSNVSMHYGNTTNGKAIRFDIDHANGWIRHSNRNSNIDYLDWQDYHSQLNIVRFSHTGANGTKENKRLALNGYLIPSDESSEDSTLTLNLDANDKLCFGSNNSDLTALNGKISEVIIYNENLNSYESEAIENYLRAKWQKGLDGLSTNALSLHLDAMKTENIMTDANATSCDDSTHTIASFGDSVSCILDRSGNNNHAGQATAASRPTLNSSGINNMSSILFDGSDDYLTSTMAGFAGGNARFTNSQVAQTTSSSTQSIFSIGVNNTNRQIWSMEFSSNTQTVSKFRGGELTFDSLPNISTNPVATTGSYSVTGSALLVVKPYM